MTIERSKGGNDKAGEGIMIGKRLADIGVKLSETVSFPELYDNNNSTRFRRPLLGPCPPLPPSVGKTTYCKKNKRGGVSMNLKGAFAVVLSALLVLLPVVPASGASVAGQMITRGTAEINGVAAPAVTSVFAGDRIATEKASSTSLSFPSGNSVVIPELSKATLGEKDGRVVVRLEDGAVSVLNKGNAPIIIEARGARIQAASNAPAVYNVVLHGNALRVVASSGAAHVETADHAGDVTPGMALSATFAPAPPQSSGISTSTWIWIVVGVAAGVGLGVGIYEAEKGSSGSPSS